MNNDQVTQIKQILDNVKRHFKEIEEAFQLQNDQLCVLHERVIDILNNLPDTE
jgi:hypothetical protein